MVDVAQILQKRKKGGHPPGVGKHPKGVGGHWLIRWKRTQTQKGKRTKIQGKAPPGAVLKARPPLRRTVGTPGQLGRAVFAPPSLNVRPLMPPAGAGALSADASGQGRPDSAAPATGSASASAPPTASASSSTSSSSNSSSSSGGLSAGAIAGIAVGAAAGLLLLAVLVLLFLKRRRAKGAAIGRVSANKKSTRGYARRGPNSAVTPTIQEEEDTFEHDMMRWIEAGGGSGRLFPHSQIKKSLNRIPSGSEPLGCTSSGTLVFHESQKPSPTAMLPRLGAGSAPVSPLKILPASGTSPTAGTSLEAPAALPPPAAGLSGQPSPAFGVAPLSLVHDSIAKLLDI